MAYARISSWIMGYGDQVVVEKPHELRDRVRQVCRSMLERYSD